MARECPDCMGSGMCVVCSGSGHESGDPCEACSGMGVCPRCTGKGVTHLEHYE